MYICRGYKRFVVWTLIFMILFANIATLLMSPKVVKAADAEPNFDFSKETWVKKSTEDVIVHTVPYTQGSEKGNYVKEYTYNFDGEAERDASGFGARNMSFNARIYRISGQHTYDLVIAKNTQTGVESARSLIVEGLYFADNDTMTTTCKDNTIPGKPNLAFYMDKKQAPLINACYVVASGGTDSLYSWYIKKTANYLVSKHTEQDWTAMASLQNLPAITYEKVTVPQECQDLILKEPLGGKADALFAAMDPNKIIFKDGKSPLSAAEDSELYYMLYKSPGAEYPDIHFESDQGYRRFLTVYQEAAQGVSSYWDDVAKAKEGAALNAVKAEALPIGAKAVSLGLDKLAMRYTGAFFADAAVSGSIAAGEVASTLFWPLTAVAATYVVAGKGISEWKIAQNVEYQKSLAKLTHAAIYIPNHIAFHSCMVKNKVPGWTQESLDKEYVEWERANQLFKDIFKDFLAAETRAQDDGAGNAMCGYSWTSAILPTNWIGIALCAILQILGAIANFLVDTFFKGVFDAYNHINLHHFLAIFPVAHAATPTPSPSSSSGTVSSLITVFTNSPGNQYDWVITVWKFVLGIANLFLVVVLLFLGIVNILHIQYDTYQVKKALPLLIVAIILANFSLLIMRMLIDAANILTNTFMNGGSPGNMVQDLVTSVRIDDKSQGFWNTIGDSFKNLGIMLMATIFGVIAIAGFLILGVMFYIRYTAIIVLGAVAPLAFVAMAFPPTQSLFKQWWSWTTKFIFMKPLSFFLLWIASFVADTSATQGITGWLIITALVYMAILVPWKLGGAVMAMWGGAMGTVFGTKKGGWARNKVEKWGQRKQKDLDTWAMKRLPVYGALKGRFQNAEEESQLENEREMAKQKRLHNQRAGGKFTLIRKESQAEKDLNEQQEAEFMYQLQQGTTGLSDKIIRKYSGAKNATELQSRYIKIEEDLYSAKEKLSKRGDIDSSNQAMLEMALHNMLVQQLGDEMVTTEDGDMKYDDARTALSTLRNRYNTEVDPTKKADLLTKMGRYQTAINSFEQAQVARDSKINFGNYRDKNAYGRLQKRINPRIAEEMDTILKSESIEQIVAALDPEGKGGGTSEFRFTQDDVSNYVKGDYHKISIPARYGIQSYMMALQAKIGSSGLDQLEAVGGMMKIVGEKGQKQILADVKAGMGPELVQELEAKYGKSIENISGEEILRMDISSIGSKDKELVRRIAVTMKNHPMLGAAGSPGQYVGKNIEKAKTNAEKFEEIADDPDPVKVEGAIDRLAKGVVGGHEQVLEDIEGTGLRTVADSAIGGIITRINPSGIALDDSTRMQIVEHIKNFTGTDVGVLETELQAIVPGLSVSFTPAQLPTIVSDAGHAFNLGNKISKLAKKVEANKIRPYYNARVKAMDIPTIDVVEMELSDVSSRISSVVSAGGTPGSDPAIKRDVEIILKKFGHIKSDRDEVLAKLDTGRPADTAEVLDQLQVKAKVVGAARKMHDRWNTYVTEMTDRGVMPTDPKSVEKLKNRFLADPKNVDGAIKEVV